MASMEINKDIFGNAIKEKKKRKTKLEKYLTDNDIDTFDDRLARLTFVNKMYPKGLILAGDMEFVFTFGEIKECYINGHFIATIILTQSFIEKVFIEFFNSKSLSKETNHGLDRMIKYARKKSLINSVILNMVDNLRLKRNPFVHSKDFDYPHSLSRRTINNKTMPFEQLDKDAKEAMQIMFYIMNNRLG